MSKFINGKEDTEKDFEKKMSDPNWYRTKQYESHRKREI